MVQAAAHSWLGQFFLIFLAVPPSGIGTTSHPWTNPHVCFGKSVVHHMLSSFTRALDQQNRNAAFVFNKNE